MGDIWEGKEREEKEYYEERDIKEITIFYLAPFSLAVIAVSLQCINEEC